MGHDIDPEYLDKAGQILDFFRAHRYPVGDIEGRRSLMSLVLESVKQSTPEITNVTRRIHYTTTPDGYKLAIHHHFLTGSESNPVPSAGLVYIHGGGMIASNAEECDALLKLMVQNYGVPIFTTDYRLAPEFQNPTPVEDCYAGLEWVSQHANEFNVDPNRIGVQGDSGGGALAAGIVLMARDTALEPPVAKQILVAPMLDDRCSLRFDPETESHFIWTPNDNVTAWKAVLGEQYRQGDVSEYAAPGRAKDLSGLPKTYLDVGTVDMFRDDVLNYATRLLKGGVEVELHVYPAVPHSFEAVQNYGQTTLALENRARAVKKL
jgi:acetyl esterase/lipase